MSIVIPSYNDIPLLTEALLSIESTCAAFDYEVIVVDDYCQPDNAVALERLAGDRVRVILKERRVGFSGTVNAGMAVAAHDIVLLNSDIVALPGWLEALQDSAYGIDPAIGMVSPKLIYPNGRIQYGGTYYARVLAPQWFGHLNVGAPATKPSANVATWNRSISGACVYITREAFARVGYLDDEYWLGFEDVDYGLRAWAEGVRCFYEPASMLIHHESASRGYSQGARELASMRYFWRRWSGRFMTSTLPSDAPVDYVLGSGSTPLWSAYVDSQAEGLRALGRAVKVHRIEGPRPDEQVIDELRGRDSIKIACDWTSGQTVWLASTEHGKPVYLLPGVESGSFPGEAARQSWIIANYKPEFDYIAPNRWTENQLRAETAWECRARVVPALLAPGGDDAPRDSIVTLGVDGDTRREIDDIAESLSVRSVHLGGPEPTKEQLRRVVEERARVIVATGDYDTSLPLLALQSTGAALIAAHNPKNQYEILDGFNALLVRRGRPDDLRRAVTDIMEDDSVFSELVENGRDTAARYAALNVQELDRALTDICQSAL